MVAKEALFRILDVFDRSGVTYWLDGGWGVDVLYGQQTRAHRDIDIDFDSRYTERLMEMLQSMGYVLNTDWLPVRAELYCQEYGYLDIHPFDVSDPEHIRQANPDGGYFEFKADYFGKAVFEGRTIPCISLAGQRAFHTGYELRQEDIHDLEIICKLEKAV